MPCGILVSLPGIKPLPPALESQILNHWTAREVPSFFFFFKQSHYRNHEGVVVVVSSWRLLLKADSISVFSKEDNRSDNDLMSDM